MLTATSVRTHCRHSPPRPDWRRPYGLALITLALGFGCTRPNPAYFPDGPDSGGKDSRGNDAPADTGTTADTGVDRGIDRGPDTMGDTAKADTNKPDVQADTGGSDAGDAGFVCSNAGQCTSHFGAAPCGSWTCPAGTCVLNCPNCTDLDGDGYGVGTGCAGPDCDDTDPTVLSSVVSRPCPAGASTQGTCRLGTQSCTAGVWSACGGRVFPSGEACNGQDDDCNGTPDDGLPSISCGLGACLNTVPSCTAGVPAVCTPKVTVATGDTTCDHVDDDCDGLVDEDCPDACLHVSPDGDDSTGDGTVLAPFQSIPMAITIAAPMGKNVCVAGGQTCQDHATYTVANGPAPLNMFQMADGVSLYGNFESTGWTRCDVAGAAPNPTTTLDLRQSSGVLFPNVISKPTTLDGFVLARNSSGNPLQPVAAVTVNGAANVQLSNLVVNDSPSANQVYGVYLLNGAQALITHSLIFGGAGTAASYGVLAVNSTPRISENCAIIDGTGRCQTDCTQTLAVGIGSRISAATGGDGAGVWLDSSPGAVIETSTICGAQGSTAAGIHITGNAIGTVIRASSISASAGATSSFGIFAEDCINTAPWIVDNNLIQGQGPGSAAGIVSQGLCAPVIDGNALITNGGDSTTSESDGVLCQVSKGQVSACAVLGNKIQGLTGSRPMVSAGIACKAGACARVANNVVSGSSAVNNVYGVWLQKNGSMVDRNRITGGCSQSTVGLLADDSFTHIQNNLITAGSCTGAILTASPTNIGVRVLGANDQNEIDIDSNTIDGGGNAGLVTCTSTAVALDSPTNTALTAPKGIIRNNIMSGGACNSLLTLSNTRTDFAEAKTSTDPRLFQNNDLDPTGTGALTLYLDEGTTARASIDAINKLNDITTSGNISQDPKFVTPPTDLHLGATSACKGAGAPDGGAPTTDFEGMPRLPAPSIGAYQ